MGFNRISIGIQDFDPDVQNAIHRVQDQAHINQIVRQAQDVKFESINFDLIYGLPRQTLEGFRSTLRKTIMLNPDRISIYHYAHLPEKFPAQKRILSGDIPDSSTKLKLHSSAINMLESAGYVHIGMDHFAKKNDSLTRALADTSIQRNFQGYSTHNRCELIGLGVSAIGDIGGCLYQNEKTLAEYYSRLDQSRLPVSRGLVRSEDDNLRQGVIMSLMCSGKIDKTDFQEKSGQSFEQYFRNESQAVSDLQKDGLISIQDNTIEVSSKGRLMLRNIAMVVDKYRKPETQTEKAFSKIH